MPYDPSKLLLFCHVPHTGGTSVWSAVTQMVHPSKLAHRHFLRSQGDSVEELYPQTDQYFTWLRDPVERFISQYHHWKTTRVGSRNDTIDMDGFHLVAGKSTIDEYAEWTAPRREFGLLNLLPLGNYPDRIKDFMFVGILERMQDCLDAVAKMVGLAPVKVQHLQQNIRSEQLSLRCLTLIKEGTRLEAEIYAKAVEVWSPLWDAASRRRSG